MRKILCPLVLALSGSLWAQPTVNWASTATGTQDDHALDVTTDANGNIVQVGHFRSNTLNIQGTILQRSPFVSIGGSQDYADVFVAKYTAAGVLQWVFRSSGNLAERALGVDTDAEGNIFVVGYYNGDTAVFGGSQFVHPGDYRRKGYLLKLGPDGALQWARSLVGTIGSNYANSAALSTGVTFASVQVDGDGNVCVGGQYQIDNVTVGGVTHPSGSPQGVYGIDVLVVKYDTDGNVLWSQRGTGPTYEEIGRIAVDANGHVLATGYSNSTAFNVGGTNITGEPAFEGIYTFKLNGPDGALLWGHRFGGLGGSDYGNALATDANGNVYVGGQFHASSIEFAGSTLQNNDQNSGFPTADLFLVKYDANGQPQWITSGYTGPIYGQERVTGVAVDAHDCVYITGAFNYNVRIGTDSLVNYYEVPNPSADILVAKYSTLGVPLWARSAGGPGADESSNIHLAPNGELLITGSYRTNGGGIIFDGISYPPSTGFRVPFLASFAATTGSCNIPQSVSDDRGDRHGITAYPNPVSDVLTISTADGIHRATVLDVAGRVVHEVRANGIPLLQVDLGHLPTGTYLVRVHDGHADVAPKSFRIVKLAR